MSFYRMLCFAGAVLTAHAAQASRVGILVNVPPTTPAAVIEALQAETEEALKNSGMELLWTFSQGEAARETYDRVVSLRLIGRCVPVRPEIVRRSHVLGFTHISDGTVLPFVEINCDTVLRVMESGSPWVTPYLPPTVFGRALGRVLVHEMLHVLTVSSAHDREGLTKPAFNRTDLTLGGLHLADAALQRLRQSLGVSDLQAENGSHQRAHAEE
ncbi:hypothetical protein [Paludibaculum fermentans]|uniref:Uncharacterized protein n=1 Tax=Paludibaculum fermentans TaxID=1473598 RepID=A0A7S7NS99_PALFE|nr:hypothetical protein [Paludibaculum fermentans]QOY88744.1 hypothetical protein IRI77_01915 [Paludibaculum fermentans]